MAQPPSYNREKNFADDFGNETDHSSLNAELDRASNSINDIRSNLAILQADDGKLRPAVVTADSISDELRVSLVEGVVMDAQSMLDRSLAAADASSKSAAAAKASETVALECKVSAVQSATSAQQSAAEAAESAGKAKQVNADWNATEGYAQILNKPTTLAGLELADIHTRKRSMTYQAGDVVIAPYLEDAILVCTTAGTTSGEELSRDIVIAGFDIEDGSVVWKVRDKFSTGLKTVQGSVSLADHAFQTREYGGGNSQYFGHVKVIDDAYSNADSGESITLSPVAVREIINNVMLGKSHGVITQSGTWVCPVSGTYEFTYVGGGGGGGAGGVGKDLSWRVSVGGDRESRSAYHGGGGGGGGGCGGFGTDSFYVSEGTQIQIYIGAGGAGGSFPNGKGGDGGTTSLVFSSSTLNSTGGGGGNGGGDAWRNGNSTGGGSGGAAGTSANGTPVSAATNGSRCGSNTYSDPPSGANGGDGAICCGNQVVSQFGNGGGGGGGSAASGGSPGIGGYAQSLAQGNVGTRGGNGSSGAVYIKLLDV